MKEGSQNNTDRDDDSLQHDERLSADEKLMRGMLRMSRGCLTSLGSLIDGIRHTRSPGDTVIGS